jgi:cation transport ATPase
LLLSQTPSNSKRIKHDVTSRMTLQDALTFAGIVLIAAIPLAIQLVTTRTLSVASLSLARHGIIVNRLAALEELAGAFWFRREEL